MDKNNGNFSMNDAIRLAQSDAGQQLLNLLQASGGDQFQNIIDLASAGHMQQAAQQLSKLLNNKEAKALVEQLGGTTHE